MKLDFLGKNDIRNKIIRNLRDYIARLSHESDAEFLDKYLIVIGIKL